MVCNKHQYIIPLFHAKQKHQNMKPSADFDKNGKLIADLNFDEMMPVILLSCTNVSQWEVLNTIITETE